MHKIVIFMSTLIYHLSNFQNGLKETHQDWAEMGHLTAVFLIILAGLTSNSRWNFLKKYFGSGWPFYYGLLRCNDIKTVVYVLVMKETYI